MVPQKLHKSIMPKNKQKKEWEDESQEPLEWGMKESWACLQSECKKLVGRDALKMQEQKEARLQGWGLGEEDHRRTNKMDPTSPSVSNGFICMESVEDI